MTKRIDASDKRLINCSQVDVNQLMPLKYHWAWEHYLNGCANHWMPSEVPMTKDIETWRSDKLSHAEKKVLLRVLGFFSTAESIVGNNIVLGIFRFVTNAEARQYLLRQAFEECYSDDTEVLTPSGWVLFSDLQEGTEIAQHNEDGTIEFVVPSRITKQWREEDLIHVTNTGGHIDLLVTRNHRMVNLDDSGKLRIETAEEVPYSHRRPICGGLKKGGSKVALTPWERFLIAFQADGSIPPSGGKYPNRDGSISGKRMVRITVKKERKKERLRDILESAELTYKESSVDKRGRITFYIWCPEMPSKTFDWVHLADVSVEWCQQFIDEMSYWDGHRTKACKDHVSYGSTIESNVDVVQAVAALAGYRCKRNTSPDNRSETFSDMHNIGIVRDRSWLSRGVVNKYVTPYKGYVYCATVPSGMLLVRRNKAVAVCGNCLHSHMFLYIVDSLGLDEGEVFNMYHEVPTITEKDAFQLSLTAEMLEPGFTTATTEGAQAFLRNLIGYYIIMEGIFFYTGFAMIFSFHRRNLMTGIGEQYQYLSRDEAGHLNFGVDLINGIKAENPELWTPEFQQQMIDRVRQAVEIEVDYAKDCLREGILGLNADLFRDYVQYIADRRLERIGLPIQYGSKNPFPWMSETIDLAKEKNFFETRVTDYQAASSLKWD